MEVGSGSCSNSESSDSFHGLKFGKKIYFEAAAGGGGRGGKQGKQGGGLKNADEESGRPPPPAPAKKGRSGVFPGGGQPPRCQVEGCNLDLSDTKPYYSRHKVCGPHSKSGQVIVGGLQQRFCQQCSRFHQLPEFDQGKRSCRRRLAGHNERRRKPQPGSLLPTRYGILPSSLFETNSRPGSFLMDFSSYSSLNGRDSWPNARTSERATSNEPTAMGKSIQHPWQNNSESHPDLLLEHSAARSTYVAASASGISSGECFTGVSDSSCALSLLSTHSWGSRNHSSSLGVNGLLNTNETPPIVRPSSSHGEANSYLSSSLWGFKECENNGRSHEIAPNLRLRQLSQASNCEYSCNVDAPQQHGRECLGLEHSRGYESPLQNMHWSL